MIRICTPLALALALAVSCVGAGGSDFASPQPAPGSSVTGAPEAQNAPADGRAAEGKPAEEARFAGEAKEDSAARDFDAPAAATAMPMAKTESADKAKDFATGRATTSRSSRKRRVARAPRMDAVYGGGAGIVGLGNKGGLAEAKKQVARRPAPPPPSKPMPRTMPAPEAEPVVADPGGTFVHAGTNPMVRTEEDRQSTFSIDVDTASYNYARRFLQSGSRPNPGSVRVEEWVNAFHYDYEGPGSGAPFAVHLDGAPSPFSKERHLVRVGIQGQHVRAEERKPVHLTFLVDVSGSMTAHDKLPLAQRSLHLLTSQLTAKDSVSLVTYAGRTGEVLSQTRATTRGKARIHRAIDNLRSGGGTNMGSGMEIAYRNAGKFVSPESVSRVIVLSDGDANIGRTSHQQILKSIKGYVSEGVKMSTIGFGTGNYRDHLMEQLADAGDGNYTYIDSEKAAKKAFVDDLTGTLQVIAKDVKIQVEFDPTYVSTYRLIGYENRDIADKDFDNDKVDAGEIGAGHTVTAMYEVVLTDAARTADKRDALATVRVRYKQPKGVRSTKIERTLKVAHLKDRFGDLDDNVRFASAVAIAAEVLRGSEHAAHLTLDDAWAVATEALEGPYKDERQEFVNLMNKNRRGARNNVAWSGWTR